MSETPALFEGLLGRDATHRTRKFDTHLTHGCIELFRHFSRVRSECAPFAHSRNRAILPKTEGAIRTLGETAR